MVTVPVRGSAAGFAATVIATRPLPDPPAPPLTVIHEADDAAVQAQPAAVVTSTLTDCPAAAALVLAALSE